ncbi:MAG: Protein translocase subunit SecF [Microgenomates group bacterium GW2011_GWC1_46_20]|nr:MAG: Protein translocase subunit SecF [Microgenomates group bacterium GW2011_GWC1_46_20]
MHVNFMKYKWVYFGISLAILIPGLLSLIFYGLRPSIDFTGGTLLEIQTPAKNFSEVAKNQNLELSSVQPSADNTYLLRFKTLDKDQNEKFKSALGPDLIEKRYESVGPIVGAEMTKKALLAVALASIAIVIYIAWSFRGVPKPYSSWKFGVSAVAALLHDALVVLGIFSLFGHFYHVEIDALFVTALLTVIGFSVHDTIVVFDRVRENLPKMYTKPFSEIVDFSLTETLVRSLNTSLTVIPLRWNNIQICSICLLVKRCLR